MSCVICHCEIVSDACVMIPCGHLVHRNCRTHREKMPNASQREHCSRCNSVVTGYIDLFLNLEEGEKEPENEPARLHNELYGCAFSYAKYKEQHGSLTTKCAQLHDHRQALQQKLQRQLSKQNSATPNASQGDSGSSPLTLQGFKSFTNEPTTTASSGDQYKTMDAVSLQVYILEAQKQLQEEQAATAKVQSEIAKAEVRYKALKEKQRANKRKLSRRSASPLHTVKSSRDGIAPTRKKHETAVPRAEDDSTSPLQKMPGATDDDSEFQPASNQAPPPAAPPVVAVAPEKPKKKPTLKAPKSSPHRHVETIIDVDEEPEVIDVECLSDNSSVVIISPAKGDQRRAPSEASETEAMLPFNDAEAMKLTRRTLNQVLPPTITRDVVPKMGVSVGRSLRDLPRTALHQQMLPPGWMSN